jgi:hypothetical protein
VRESGEVKRELENIFTKLGGMERGLRVGNRPQDH